MNCSVFLCMDNAVPHGRQLVMSTCAVKEAVQILHCRKCQQLQQRHVSLYLFQAVNCVPKPLYNTCLEKLGALTCHADSQMGTTIMHAGIAPFMLLPRMLGRKTGQSERCGERPSCNRKAGTCTAQYPLPHSLCARPVPPAAQTRRLADIGCIITGVTGTALNLKACMRC